MIFIEPKKNFIDALSQMCLNRIGIDPRHYTLPALIGVAAIVILGGGYALLANASISFDSNNQTASVASAGNQNTATNIKGDNNNISINNAEGAPKFDLLQGKWENGIGDLAGWRKNSNVILLPDGIRSGLLRYSQPMPINSRYYISFKPHGNEAINFVITVPGLYEIVIGDSDYKTVVLKRSVGTDFVPSVLVQEIISEEERATFQYKVKRNEEIAVNIDQKMLPNNDLWVQLDVLYWGEGSNQKQPQTFQYEFKPSARKDDSLFLEIGLVGGDTWSDISAELVNPSLTQ